MAYGSRVLRDSVAPCGKRLVTIEVKYPRSMLAEANTHRLLSKNTGSSRAIPIEKLIQRVLDDPYIPIRFGSNKPGMQAGDELSKRKAAKARRVWLASRDEAVARCRELSRLGLHKQWANRIIEPYQFIISIWSATEWDNLFHQRRRPDAQPEFEHVANLVHDAIKNSKPCSLKAGEWHLPLVDEEDREAVVRSLASAVGLRRVRKTEVVRLLKMISVARCARVSYLTHDGRRDIMEDITLFTKLRTNGHWSPFEHVAKAMSTPKRSGNFFGWFQYRKEHADEHYGGRMP